MKYKLGDLIEQSDYRNGDNRYNLDNLKGISIQKRFIETKAKMDGVSLTPYKLVQPDEFAYVTVTSRNSEKITIAHNTSNNTYIVSSSYIVFKIKKIDILHSKYLYIFFNRPEFDRYARFNSWGSAREVFSWEDMCDIEIDLPPIDAQEKYVAVYEAMVANQKAYEQGLEDLKLVCEATIEKLRREVVVEPIGHFLTQVDAKNSNRRVKLALGVNVDKEFIPAKRIADNVEGTKIVKEGQFAYNKVMKANGTKLPIALRKGKTGFVSGSYIVFEVSDTKELIPEYLMMWLSRPETQRYAGYISWGSTRDVLSFETLGEIEIPIPDLKVQKAIVDIYNAYITRREINEKLKMQIKDICPTLIAGSIKEV